MTDISGKAARALTILIRFLTPVCILYFLDTAQLGWFYLINSVIAFSSFALSFESGYYFSCKANRRPHAAGVSRYLAWIGVSQALFSVTLAFPLIFVFLLISNLFSVPLFCALMLYSYSEVVANEFGRFLGNTNQVRWLVLRDLWRAISLLAAALVAIWLFKSISLPFFFVLLCFFNCCLIGVEHVLGGSAPPRPRIGHLLRLRLLRKLPLQIIYTSKGVILQSWLMYLYPIAERLIIGKTIGVSAVGKYGFIVALFQSVLTIFFLPDITRMRSAVISHLGRAAAPEKIAGLKALLVRTVLFALLMAAGTIAASAINERFGILSDFQVSIASVLAAMIFVVSNNFIYIVSPHFSRPPYTTATTIMTSTIHLCSLSLCYAAFYFLGIRSEILFVILSLGFVTQLIARKQYL